MTTSFESRPAWKPGQRIVGKWNRNVYTIERLLGAGANGYVYLARRGSKQCALKFGQDPLDLQSEVNALKALGKRDPILRGYFIEADDAVLGDREVPFYAMKYVQGSHIGEFLKKRGVDWFYPVMLQLLGKLVSIHRSGFVFGDLKRDNVLVAPSGSLELIDFGGVTQRGRSVRQFTEIYDRGYWSLGDRKAEPSYDLFSFAVLCLQLADPHKELDASAGILPQRRSLDTLLEVLERCPLAPAVKTLLRGLLEGKWSESGAVLQQWRHASVTHTGRRAAVHDPTKWLSGALAVSALAFFVSLYILLQ